MMASSSDPIARGTRAPAESPDKSVTEIHIGPSGARTSLDWAELYRFRDLFRFLVARDVKVLYKQTVLGLGWAVVRPLFSTLVFTVIFGNLANVPSDGMPYALFALAAMVPWTYFSSALAACAESLIGAGHLMSKVYFPRVFIPAAPVVAKLVDFGIGLAVLWAAAIWYGYGLSIRLLFLPIAFLPLLATLLGLGLWLSALAVRYRDVKHALQFGMQVLLYAAPIVWPVSLIPEQWRLLYALYPVVGVIEAFRSIFAGSGGFPWDLWGVGMASSLALFWIGLRRFKSIERHFADVA